MHASDSVIGVFADQGAAEIAVRRLITGGSMAASLSVLGKAYDRSEKAAGLFVSGGTVRFWGERGACWGRLWSLFSGGLFVTVPVVGPVIVLGRMATKTMSAVEDMSRTGGSNAVGIALSGIGIPDDSVVQYEFAIKADGFLVMAHGSGTGLARARGVLVATDPARLDTHPAARPPIRVASLSASGP